MEKWNSEENGTMEGWENSGKDTGEIGLGRFFLFWSFPKLPVFHWSLYSYMIRSENLYLTLERKWCHAELGSAS
jgi:hypothetical protein